MSSRWVTRIKYSPLSRWAALPMRARLGLSATARHAGAVLRWLATSREWANFSYDLTPQGVDAVACAIAVLGERPLDEVRGWADELRRDTTFAERYAERVRHTRLRHISDRELRYGRCLVRYLLVRAAEPRLVFEAGTDRGLSTWAMVRALRHAGLAPGRSRIVTVDLAEDRGDLLDGDEGGYVQRRTGDSVQVLRGLDTPVDLFVHDTTSDDAHMRAQLAALAPRLAPGGWLHSAWFTAGFVEHCQRHGLRVLQYAEQPQGHWYPGSRCGIARARPMTAGCTAPPAGAAGAAAQPTASADAATRGP